MNGQVREVAGTRVFVCAAEGACVADDRALSDLLGELMSAEVTWVAIPLARLGPDFLRLSSGVAGQVLQKLVNYRRRVAVLGDASAAAQASGALHAFIAESNRGRTVWFVPDLAALEARLAAWPPPNPG